MVKISIRSNFQIKTTDLTASLRSSSARCTQAKRLTLSPVEQSLCQQALGIFLPYELERHLLWYA